MIDKIWVPLNRSFGYRHLLFKTRFLLQQSIFNLYFLDHNFFFFTCVSIRLVKELT